MMLLEVVEGDVVGSSVPPSLPGLFYANVSVNTGQNSRHLQENSEGPKRGFCNRATMGSTGQQRVGYAPWTRFVDKCTAENRLG
jgi:hypothetical protein